MIGNAGSKSLNKDLPLDAFRATDTLAYCVGAQKSGTTWLAARCAVHHNIHFPVKEAHYWDYISSPFTRGPQMGLKGPGIRMRLRRKLGLPLVAKPNGMFSGDPYDHQRYAKFMIKNRKCARILADFTPNYALCARHTFLEMSRVHHNPKFIFIMRDPVDRLLSGIRHRLRWALPRYALKTPVVERALIEAIEEPHHPDYRMSKYELTIINMESVIESDRIMYLFYEGMFCDETLESVGEFLGLDTPLSGLGQVENKGVEIESGISPELISRARDALSETYDFVLGKFGASVPKKWLV